MKRLIILVILILTFTGCQQKQTSTLEIVGYGEDTSWQVTLLPVTSDSDNIVTFHLIILSYKLLDVILLKKKVILSLLF